MKRTCLAAAILLGFAFSNSSAFASTMRVSQVTAHTQTVQVKFLLTVSGHDPSLTYWVAYGPLNGHFGLVQLHSRGANRFGAVQKLPQSGRTIFAYLASHGVTHTRFGLEPGNQVTTIKRVGPVALLHLHLLPARWTVPQAVG